MAIHTNRSRFWLVALALVSAGLMSLFFVVQLDSTKGVAVSPSAPKPSILDETIAADSTTIAKSQVDTKLNAGSEKQLLNQRTKEKVDRRVIVYLKSRRHIVTVYSSSEGPKFGLSSRDGKLLAAELSVSELKDQYPELYRMYNSSYAEAWAGL